MSVEKTLSQPSVEISPATHPSSGSTQASGRPPPLNLKIPENPDGSIIDVPPSGQSSPAAAFHIPEWIAIGETSFLRMSEIIQVGIVDSVDGKKRQPQE